MSFQSFAMILGAMAMSFMIGFFFGLPGACM